MTGYIIGHTPVIVPEPKYAYRLEGLPHRPEPKWVREKDITMTLGQTIEAAADLGYYMCMLREVKAGSLWAARFERVVFEPGKTRARNGAYAETALEAVYSAYEEIQNPGVNDKRSMTAMLKGHAIAHTAAGLDRLVERSERPEDPYRLEKLLRDNAGLSTRLEDALRGLLYSLTGEDDEDDVV